jgi:hypothetical protein
MVVVDEHEYIQLMWRRFRRYIHNLATQKRIPE